jgi:hypothetical protein
MHYCYYYQAKIPPHNCWLITGLLRSHDHIAFDRTIDVENSIFEFFVPQGQEEEFVVFMRAMLSHGIIDWFKKLPNRIELELDAQK